MSNVLGESGQVVVERLLDSANDTTCRQALTLLMALSDEEKEKAAAILIERLPREQDARTRAWGMSALAAVNAGASFLAAHIDPKESSEEVRYWALIALVQVQPPNLKECLILASEDDSPWVRAIALRLLVDQGAEEYTDRLLSIARGTNWLHRTAICRALRRQGHYYMPFPESLEAKIIPILQECLLTRSEIKDCQYQAALALGDIKHQRPEAVKILSEALKLSLPDMVRRACVDALAQINQPEIKDALLGALSDQDAEIRVRAARALKKVLGPSAAANFIIEYLLRLDHMPAEYIDALRRIDKSAAADILLRHLSNPDPKVAANASQVLAKLSEETVRILQEQRTRTIETYTKLLGDADAKILGQLDSLMHQTQTAFRSSIAMQWIIFIVSTAVLGIGLYIALAPTPQVLDRNVGVGGAVAGFTTLLVLFYTGPLKNIRQSMTDLVRVNAVFMGYVRQIHQIDTVFKQLYLGPNGLGTVEMQENAKQIRDSITQTMEDVNTYLSPE